MSIKSFHRTTNSAGPHGIPFRAAGQLYSSPVEGGSFTLLPGANWLRSLPHLSRNAGRLRAAVFTTAAGNGKLLTAFGGAHRMQILPSSGAFRYDAPRFDGEPRASPIPGQESQSPFLFE